MSNAALKISHSYSSPEFAPAPYVILSLPLEDFRGWLASGALHSFFLCVILYFAFAFVPASISAYQEISIPVVFVGPTEDPVSSLVEQKQMASPKTPAHQPPVVKQSESNLKATSKDMTLTEKTENSEPIPQASTGLYQGLPLLQSPDFLKPPVPPVYPGKSVANNEQGTVIVRALIDPTGNPQDILIWQSSGYALLDKAAKQAVGQWQFVPAKSGFQTVAAWVEVPVNFVLR